MVWKYSLQGYGLVHLEFKYNFLGKKMPQSLIFKF